MKRNILTALILSFAIIVGSAAVAFAMPSYEPAPDASTWKEETVFKAADYLQTSLLNGRLVGLRGESTSHLGLYSSLKLPKMDEMGRTITWTSSDERIIASDGTLIARPAKTTYVTMTAAAAPLENEESGYEKAFQFEVFGEYVIMDSAPGVKEMLFEENFHDGAYDEDIFEVETGTGNTCAVEDGALVIHKNTAEGNRIKIWHRKDRQPLNQGVYVEEFTFDRKAADGLGGIHSIQLNQYYEHPKNGPATREIGGPMFERTNGTVGGFIRFSSADKRYNANYTWGVINWGGNGNNENTRLGTSKSTHIKLVWNLDDGYYCVYLDGNLVSMGGVDENGTYSASSPYFGFQKCETGDTDDEGTPLTWPANAYYTEIGFGDGSKDMGDYFAISDYKFYQAKDLVGIGFTGSAPNKIFSNIPTAYIWFNRINDSIKIGEKEFRAGDKLVAIVAAYNGSGAPSGIFMEEITIPADKSISNVPIQAYPQISTVDKSGGVKAFLWDSTNTITPICDDQKMQY